DGGGDRRAGAASADQGRRDLARGRGPARDRRGLRGVVTPGEDRRRPRVHPRGRARSRCARGPDRRGGRVLGARLRRRAARRDQRALTAKNAPHFPRAGFSPRFARDGTFARAALMAKRTIARGSFSARARVASSASTNQSTSFSERTSGGRILITFESWPDT